MLNWRVTKNGNEISKPDNKTEEIKHDMKY